MIAESNFLQLVRIFILLLFRLQCAAAVPQNFGESYSLCTFHFGEKSLSFSDKLWTINSRDFILQFSLCKPVLTSCKNQSSSCLIEKRSQQVTNLGDEFVAGDEDDFTLISSKGSRCRSNPSKTYTLSISLQCSDSIKPKPFLMQTNDEDDCTFEVVMMRPDCRPKCTETISNSHFLDFRNFRKNIQVEMDSKKFSLRLCGSNLQCSKGVSSCEILNGNSVSLASAESQHFIYDAGKNELTARGRYKQGRVVRDVQVLMKCNWGTDLGTAKYKKPQAPSRHYKFELESSLGCIKLPQNCVVSSIDNLHYNLTDLYKPKGWEVSGVPQGKIFLNICGPLHQLQSTCLDQYSQVCHQHNKNYINRGSILLPLRASDDVIRATFVSGSTCSVNPQILYSTEIEFECSERETGPVFKETKNCTTHLIWKTPHACPLDYYTSSNCYMNDRVSNRNLQKLYSQNDRIHPLAPNNKTRLIYNLCGSIHEPCGQFDNVSFCLKSERNDLVIGWENKQLISEHGQLRMELEGSSCRNRRSTAAVTIRFVCTYESRPPAPQITVIEDSCKYTVTIFTPLACTWRGNFQSCINSSANLEYDLSALTLRNRNYVVSAQDVDYVFNLCGPVVSGPGALCRGDTMVCLNNRTEPNVKHRYRSLGSVGGPRMRNGSLVVEAAMGAYCPGLGYYKSVIYFECSKQGFAPEFVSRTDCVYNFKWKTPEACPQQKKCVIPGSKPDTGFDLTELQKKQVPVYIENQTNLYHLHLCADTYVVTTNGVGVLKKLKRKYILSEGDSYIVLDLENICDNKTDFTKIFLKLQCSENDSFEQVSYEKCVLNMTLKTRAACAPKKEQLEYFIIEPQESRIPEDIPEIIPTCTLTNTFTGFEFHLNTMNSTEIFLNDTNYVVNLDGALSQCGGIFCKNRRKMVASVCPTPLFNYNNRVVLLTYSGVLCAENSSYDLNILLKCNHTKSGGKILEDDQCKSVITFDTPEACFLLKQEIVSAGHLGTGAMAGIVAALLLIGICVIVVVIKRQQCRPYLRYVPFYRNKTDVPIYMKDSTL